MKTLRVRPLALAVAAALAAAAALAGAARADGPVFAVVSEDAAAVATPAAFDDARLAEDLDAFLRAEGAPLAGSGAAFVASGRRHGLDPRFLVALSGAESSFGKFLFRPFNPFGWGYFTFSSWAEAIETVAAGLEKGYLSEGRTDVSSISAKYAPVGASNDIYGTNGGHPGNVAKFLTRLGGNPADVRGTSAPGASVVYARLPGVSAPAGEEVKTVWGNSLGAQAASLALEFVGVPYVWGGETPRGFDCSGLTMYVYAKLGVKLSHWTGHQQSEGTPVSIDQLAPGDLVFFDLRGDVPAHMGMYIGNGLMVHAPRRGDVVKVVPFDDGYRGRFASAIRPYSA